MARPRLCSECGQPLPPDSYSNRRTCSDTCRAKRSRRLRKEKAEREAERAMPEEVRMIKQITRSERDDEIHRVIREELRPVVRESITEDTMRAIQELIALTPEAVAAIREDLLGDDPVLRQRAYTLIAKYTIGHPALVRPPEEEAGKKLEVHFNIPRPEGEAEGEQPLIEAQLVDGEEEPDADTETRECDMCHASKPLNQFVADSYRCLDCFAEQQRRAAEISGGS